MKKRWGTKRAFFLLALGLSGCVLPPSSEGPRVVAQEELNYLTSLQQGKDYALSGRSDIAELRLREAIELKKSQKEPLDPTLLSDLGYVMRAQNRLAQAREYLAQALKADPHSLQIRENYARVLFDLGEISPALAEYQTMEDEYWGYWKGAPETRLSQGYQGRDLLALYRNLAILNALVGNLGESACCSQKAVDLGDGNYTAASHARFLVTLEELAAAQTIFQTLMSSAPSEDPQIVLDLGVVLYLQDKKELATEAFERVISSSIVTPENMLYARIFRYHLAKEKKDEESKEINREGIVSSSLMVCSSSEVSSPNYWPIRLKDEVEVIRNEVCNTSR